MRERSRVAGKILPMLSGVLEFGSKIQPFSKESREKTPRIRDAQVVHSVCPIVLLAAASMSMLKMAKSST